MTVTWNASDKSSNITLTNGNLTATTTSATQGAVRCNTSASSGKYYWEASLEVLAGSAFAVGWSNSSSALGTAMGGTDKNSVVVDSVAGTILFNNTSQGSLGAGIALFTVCIAYDITNKLIWFRNDAGLWNGSATASPGSGTGGVSLSAINAGPYFPVFAANSSGAQVIANFGATDFNYPIPSGFSALDTDVQAYNASSKFLGYSVLQPPINAASASKFLGYSVLEPPINAASASKFLGYAILTTIGTYARPIVCIMGG